MIGIRFAALVDVDDWSTWTTQTSFGLSER
jgi:hypothetical protein